MRSRLALALCFALLAGPAGTSELEPYKLTRSLTALQDQAALGTIDTSRAQSQLLLRIGERFAAAEPAIWTEPRNARAAIVYVLAGGQPRFLSPWLQLESPPLPRPLVAGALAYASARSEVALVMLGQIDATTLPAALGGHLALVQATLILKDDPARAAELLRWARLVMPGSLVAEAALRRQIIATSRIGEMKTFGDLVARYFRRYGRSLYAGDLVDRLPPLWIAIQPGEADALAELDRLTAALPEAEHRRFLLSVARLALLDGRMLLANHASAAAALMAASGTRSSMRSELYFAATAVTGDAHERAVAALDKMEEASLPPPDRALREAALAIASQLRKQPAEDPEAEQPALRERAAVVSRAEQVLDETEALLRSATE